MSKDPMSKIRAGDVWKGLERVLQDYHVPKSDWSVEDVRPHPKLTVTFAGQTRTIAFAGTPSNRNSHYAAEKKLRAALREMQSAAIAGVPAPTARPVVKAITFRGVEIDTVMHDGEPFVALKPIVEGMGLNWNKQLERVKRDAVLCEGVTISVIPSRGGPQTTTLLKLKMLNGFLFGISEGSAREELRAGILAYKRECYDVLARYWLHGEAVRTAEPALPPPSTTGLSRDALHDLGGVVKAVTGKAVSDLRADVYAAIEGLAALIRTQQAAPSADLVVVRDFVSSLAIVSDMAMVPAGSRYRGLSVWVSRRMVAFSAAHGFEVKRVQRFPGEKLVFARAAAEEWLRATGMREIWAAVDRRNGPGPLFEGAA